MRESMTSWYECHSLPDAVPLLNWWEATDDNDTNTDSRWCWNSVDGCRSRRYTFLLTWDRLIYIDLLHLIRRHEIAIFTLIYCIWLEDQPKCCKNPCCFHTWDSGIRPAKNPKHREQLGTMWTKRITNKNERQVTKIREAKQTEQANTKKRSRKRHGIKNTKASEQKAARKKAKNKSQK